MATSDQAESARLLEARRMAAINRIGRLLNSSLSLDQILQTAVEVVSHGLGFSSLGVLLLDRDDPRTLVLRARSGPYASLMPREYRQSIDVGIIGAVARSRTRILLPEVRADPRYVNPMPGANDIVSELAVPVLAGDQLLGVLNVESRQPLTEDDARGLEIVADQLGAALNNAQLYEAEQRRSARGATVSHIARLITGSLSLDQILRTAVEAISQGLGYHNVALLLTERDDPEWLHLRARSGVYGSRVGEYRQHISQGVIGAAARTRRRLLIDDVTADPRYIPIPSAPELRSELSLPLVAGDELLGVLNIESERRIPEDDASGLEIVADQLAIAIKNASLFEQTRNALEEAQLLYETSRRISIAPDIDEVVRVYLEQVAARGRYAASVALFDFNQLGDEVALVLRGRWSPRDGFIPGEERVPYARGNLDPPMDSGQSIKISNVHTDPRCSEMLREIQRRDARPALAFIPLLVRGHRIGFVALASPNVHDWSDDDLRPYQVTAALLAATIDSRRQQLLVYERGQQVAVLEERQRLARELHDSVTQSVFSVTLIAQTLALAWRRDPAEGEKRVERVLGLSQSALAELRALLAELRPTEPAIASGMESAVAGSVLVRREGLPAALHKLALDVGRDGLRIEVETAGYSPLAPANEEAVYRIVQEALNNVVKHAHARRVRIVLHTDTNGTRLRVTDDGIGIAGLPVFREEAARAPVQRGMGMSSMRERAEALGGTLRVTPAPEGGTIVEAVIPRKDER